MTQILAAVNLIAAAVCAGLYAEHGEPRQAGFAVFCFGIAVILGRSLDDPS